MKGAGEDAIDGIVDSLANGDFKGALQTALKSVLNVVTDLSVTTKLKTGIFAETAS